MQTSLAAVAAALGGLAVALGAFGAHALRGRLDAAALAAYQTGAQYHLIHAAALLAVAGLLPRLAAPWGERAGWTLCAGTVLFAGSLYALALSGQRWLGAVAPLGGTLLLAGWAMLAIAALPRP